MYDVLLIGAGPAGIALAAALGETGLRVHGLTLGDPAQTWTNTYGIWQDELAPLGLSDMLAQRWTNCVAYAAGHELPLDRTYGLLDNAALQAHLLAQAAWGDVSWQRGAARQILHYPAHSEVTTESGETLRARLIVDASGYKTPFIRRPTGAPLAFQAAYGIVGRFSRPPVAPQQLVLMDFRADYLARGERNGPATFLYAMDLGDDLYFVEETSLAAAPAVPFDLLERRLHQRLGQRGITVTATQHVERVLFPMNLALPYRDQPVLAYGLAASLVHPATGYQVNAALRNAQPLARAIAQALDRPGVAPLHAAQAAWQTLWPTWRVRNHWLYLFGLDNVMRFSQRQTEAFFATFFMLPTEDWTDYLSNRHGTRALMQLMLRLFLRAPWSVRLALASSVLRQRQQLWHVLRP